jgi:hypothetical protein
MYFGPTTHPVSSIDPAIATAIATNCKKTGFLAASRVLFSESLFANTCVGFMSFTDVDIHQLTRIEVDVFGLLDAKDYR